MAGDQQVRRLFRVRMTDGKPVQTAAAMAGMSSNTARKYLDLQEVPSQLKQPGRDWRTREDPFADVWPWCKLFLEANPGIEIKALFAFLQRAHPGHFQDGQLRTFQRRVKTWRATEGPAKEVFFPQRYRVGERAQSDFTYMNGLDITIARQPFPHLVYHFVLCYSNWETGMVCRSESFEALS